MDLPLPKHEDLLQMGLLQKRRVGSFCIFISHQWTSLDDPDPGGQQLNVLKACLRNICYNELSVTNDAASQFFGDVKSLTTTQKSQIREGFLWLDWISIPQSESHVQASESVLPEQESREALGTCSTFPFLGLRGSY